MKKLIILFFIAWSFNINSYAQVVVKETKDGMLWEISNGNLGIGIPSEASYKKNEQQTLSPIQYFIYPNGQKSDNTPNYITIQYPRMGGSGPLGLKLKWVIRNKDECKVEILYAFRKPRFELYGKKYDGGEPGPGYYKTTIHIRKDEKSVMFLEEFDYEISHRVNISNGLEPDQYRYRGWSADSEQNGYEKPGVKYRQEAERGYPMDATKEIVFDANGKYVQLPYWEPAGGEINNGRYWMAYNKNAPKSAFLFGVFQGNPAKLYGGRGIALNLFSTTNTEEDKGQKKVELTLGLERRGADDSWYIKKRFEWGVFISTKNDLLETVKTQPIAVEMNKRSGLAKEIDDYANKPAILVPSFYEGGIFCSPVKLQQLIKRVANDDAFYQYMVNADSYYKPVFDAWRTEKAAQSLINELINFSKELKENYKTGEGIYRDDIRYWKGANQFKLKAITISCLFADKKININAAQRKELESLVRLMARILWSDTNAPINDSAGINFGTANMPTQYMNSRYFFALLLGKDPEFQKRSSLVLNEVKANIKSNIYGNGSTFGTPHYTQPAIEPILFSTLQLKYAGIADLFRDEPLIKKFADFYSSLLTPPSPRFGNNRKIISFGDGSEESAVVFGLLASGYENLYPDLSKQLNAVFQNGPPRMSLFGPVFLAVDLSTQYKQPIDLQSSNYTGYLSHHRFAPNSENETAAWILNGDSLFDHRNDDRGEIAIYSLNAPLSLSRSSFYYPQATDARIRSMVIPYSLFPEWDKSDQPVNIRSFKPGTWQRSKQIEFAKLSVSSISTSHMQTDSDAWIRRVVVIGKNAEKPIIVLFDSLHTKGDNIWSMLFMSDGPVQTPAGVVTPLKKIYNNNDKTEKPVGTLAQNLKTGVSRFHFTGQSWNKNFHSHGGIDWDVYLISQVPTSFSMSQWTTTWQNSSEQDDFMKANGRPYEESQQILRIKGGKDFFTIITPFHKGDKYSEPFKQINNETFLLKDNNDSTLITRSGFRIKNTESITLGSWSSQSFNNSGYAISGGPAEMDITAKGIKVRIHGNSGVRTFRVPITGISTTQSSAQIKLSVQKGYTEWTINYKSKGMDLLSTEQGYTEYLFNIK